MKSIAFCFSAGLLLPSLHGSAQLSPVITSWLQNNTVTGTYYMSGNSTAISNGILVNCQQVSYSSGSAYIKTTGIPSHPIGPYLDGNPNQAGNQNAIYKFPLSPQQNTGTPSSTTMGAIGVFIDGTTMFDSRDGVSWKNSSNSFAGGPSGGTGDGVWNRDAIVYEKGGFDCAKGHPAGTNYHHHQNPSAFKLDLQVISNVCNLYDSDGLYTIDSTQHSPLIGFAYDGFPVYGAYGYKNADGTGGIVRMISGYQLRNITVRTHLANGTDVTDGPAVSTTYPLGTFKEDYEFVSHPGEDQYLDIHNGRFCVTPEYPNGTYCYFATVNANHNSAYPYLIGPTFYGVYANRKVTSITESTTVYTPSSGIGQDEFNQLHYQIVPNPASDVLAVQIYDLLKYDMELAIYDMTGRLIRKTTINKGSTIAWFDTQTIYDGAYILRITCGDKQKTEKIIIRH